MAARHFASSPDHPISRLQLWIPGIIQKNVIGYRKRLVIVTACVILLAEQEKKRRQHPLQGPAKRTEEDNSPFAESFERLIQEALHENV